MFLLRYLLALCVVTVPVLLQAMLRNTKLKGWGALTCTFSSQISRNWRHIRWLLYSPMQLLLTYKYKHSTNPLVCLFVIVWSLWFVFECVCVGVGSREYCLPICWHRNSKMAPVHEKRKSEQNGGLISWLPYHVSPLIFFPSHIEAFFQMLVTT